VGLAAPPCLAGEDPARLPHILSSLSQAHRQELAHARALLLRYREALEDAGLKPPTEDGAEALARFRHAFQIAGLRDDHQHNELLADWGQP
jgi:hypothetical protein